MSRRIAREQGHPSCVECGHDWSIHRFDGAGCCNRLRGPGYDCTCSGYADGAQPPPDYKAIAIALRDALESIAGYSGDLGNEKTCAIFARNCQAVAREALRCAILDDDAGGGR